MSRQTPAIKFARASLHSVARPNNSDFFWSIGHRPHVTPVNNYSAGVCIDGLRSQELFSRLSEGSGIL